MFDIRRYVSLLICLAAFLADFRHIISDASDADIYYDDVDFR